MNKTLLLNNVTGLNLRTLLIPIFIVNSLNAGIKEETESLIYENFGDSVSVLFKKFTIPKEVKYFAEKKAGLRFLKKHIYTWKITIADSLVGYAYLDNVKGKSQPITFVVFYDSDGAVVGSHIIKYREPIGGEVSHKSWLNQFSGKSQDSMYVVGKDIDAISGATISVNAVTRGIHRSSYVIQYLLEKANE